MSATGKAVVLSDGTVVQGVAALDASGSILSGSSVPSSTTPPTKYGKAVTLTDGTVVQGTCLLDVNGNILTPGGGAGSLTQDPASTSTTLAMSANATQQAIINYDAGFNAFRGGYDASVGVFPALGGSGSANTIRAGDYWAITKAGTMGGVSYAVGNEVLALTNLPGQTAANWANIGNAGSLASLTDVNLTTPAAGQPLKYDGSKWVNGALTPAQVGLSNVKNIDTTVATNITTGTLPAAQLPQFTGGIVTTSAPGSTALTIADGNLPVTKLNPVVGPALLGNVNAGSGPLLPVSPAQANGILQATIAPVASNLTGTLNAAQLPALSGDVTSTAGTNTLTINNGVLTNAKSVPAPAATIKGNASVSAATPTDLTVSQVNGLLQATIAPVASNLTGTLNVAQLPALAGDVTSIAGTNALAINTATVTNAKLANMPATTIKGNANSSAATPADLTTSQVAAMLPAFVGDSGSGGAQGLVPTPAAGDAAAGKVLGAGGNWVTPSTAPLNVKVYFVSYGAGSDSNSGLSINAPFKTLGAACTAAGNSGNQICVLPGTDPNNYTIANQNLSITGVNSEKRGLCLYSGTITVSGTASSISINGLSIGTLVHSGAGNLYLHSVQTTTLSNTGTGYTELSDCDSTNGTVSNTGAAMMNFLAGCKVGTSTLNNAGGQLVLNGCIGANPVVVSAGTLIAWNMAISSASGTSNALTAASGSTVVMYYSQFLTPTGTPARINIAAGAVYSFTGAVYDAPNSTVAGIEVPVSARFGVLQGALATTYLTGTLQAAQEPAHTGDVTNAAGSLALTIANNAVTNGKMAQMAANTFKANITGGTANPTDVPLSTLTASLTPATTGAAGVVKVGANISVDSSGVISLPQSIAQNANPLFQYVVTQAGYIMNDGQAQPKQATIKAPPALSTDYALLLPTGLPSANGNVLVGNTNGSTAWQSMSSVLPQGSKTVAGALQVGGNIDVSGGVIDLPQNISTGANPRFAYVVADQGYLFNDADMSNQARLRAPVNIPQDYTLYLPTGLPSISGQVLSSDTSGNTSWITPASGGSGGTMTATLATTQTAGTPVRLLANGTVDGLAVSTTGNNYNITSQLPPQNNGTTILAVNNMLHCTMNDGRLVRIYVTGGGLYAQIGAAGPTTVTWGAQQTLLASGVVGIFDVQPCSTTGFAFMWYSNTLTTPNVYVQGAAVSDSGVVSTQTSVQVMGGNAWAQAKLCDMSQGATGYFCSFVTYGGNQSCELSSFTFNNTTGAISRIGGNNGVIVNFTQGCQGWAGQNLALVRYSNFGLVAFMVGSGTTLMCACYAFNVASYATVVASSSSAFNWVNQSTYGLPGCLKAVCTVNGGTTREGTIVMASTPLGASATPINIGVVQIGTSGTLTSLGGTLAPAFTSMSAPVELEIATNGSGNFFATFRSGGSAYAVSGYTSGLTATLGSQVTLGTTYQPGNGGSSTYNSGNLTVSSGGVFCYFQYDTNFYPSVTQFFAGNTTSYDIANYLGILQTGGAAGSAQTVTISGGTNTTLTGLTTQSTYYLSPTTGTITPSATAYPVGKAVSATKLVLNSPIWQGGQIVNYTPVSTGSTIVSADGSTKCTVDETGSNAGRFVVSTNSLQRLAIDATGKVTFSNNMINIAATKTPSSSSSSGTLGDICYDSGYVYVCVATNTWKRATLNTF